MFSDPNFPLHDDGRVHHLDVKPGQGGRSRIRRLMRTISPDVFTVSVLPVGAVANRILCVGDAGRGERIAQHFDDKKSWKHVSPRNFVIYTGTYKGVRSLCTAMHS